MLKTLEDTVIDLLEIRKENGVWQNEIESISGYSRSHLSETVTKLEQEKRVIRRKEGNILNRVWSAMYFPGRVEGTIRAGILRSTEYFPLIQVIEQTCKDYGNRLSVRVFDSSVEMMESLYTGSIEIAMSPAVTQITYAAIRGSLNFITAIASGGSGIYENPDSNSKYCSGSEISTMALLTKKFLESHGDIVYKPYRSPLEGISAFVSGKVKYIATWEPYSSKLESEHNVKLVAGYESLLHSLPCCIMSCADAVLAELGKIMHSIADKYRSMGDDVIQKSVSVQRTFRIFSGGFSGHIRESLKKYSYNIPLDQNIIRKIAEENGILISGDTLDHVTEEFLTPE